ncbi:tripartite motif-containing protein 16 [Danio aesculapii]|uniref:tripartite motif-containing protein 16 n=1 Tax=Danio aesculapii TaxID=1142201 RepID=UPI0024BF7894|nr:tripartite motif-containing protein 16 [Danio aesculapii]
MAEAGVSVDQFSCPVCLDVMKDPVTIPCGHSYCMSCITDCWNQEEQKNIEKKTYSCPQCRHSFRPRPTLFKNIVFAEMMEKLQKTKLSSPAGPGDVQCDVCRKYKAVQSCLVCLNSYCQTHFERHEEFHPGKRHTVIEATGKLQEMICKKHHKLLEVYCRTDQICVCMLCMVDEHRNHDTVSTALQRTEKEAELKELQVQCQQRILQKEKERHKLRETVTSHKRSANAAVQDCQRICLELVSSIERNCAKLKKQIRDQEKTAVSKAEGVLKKLQEEIDDLRRRDTEMKQLTETQDNIHFLQSLQALSGPLGESTDHTALEMTVSSQTSFHYVKESLSAMRKKLDDFCRVELKTISDIVKAVEIIPSPSPEPQTREQFLQYSCQLKLDLNSICPALGLSEGNTEMFQGDTWYNYPDHPDRFDYWEQVLCTQSVCGRSYWEIERSETGSVDIAVSYKNIQRKGDYNRRECLFGFNDHSWSLGFSSYRSSSRCTFTHNSIETELPFFPTSLKIGVYVDHRAGTLSYYSVSDKMSLIHRIQTTFTQPLYPGFRVIYGTCMNLCDLS